MTPSPQIAPANRVPVNYELENGTLQRTYWRLVPYLLRPCFRPLTPVASSAPRMMW